MSASSDSMTLALHGLRLKGFAESEAVADTVGLPVGEARALLEGLVADGLAVRRDGRISGFSLNPAGREEHARRLAAELDDAGQRPTVDGAYRDFLVLNPDLLALCTDWQLREIDGESTVNDHSDDAYDAQVVEQLSSLHAKAEPICDQLAGSLDRFQAYGPRLGHALELVRSGDGDWFTKPMIPSYHTVWFELHEDLLATLGIERGSEVTG